MKAAAATSWRSDRRCRCDSDGATCATAKELDRQNESPVARGSNCSGLFDENFARNQPAVSATLRSDICPPTPGTAAATKARSFVGSSRLARQGHEVTELRRGGVDEAGVHSLLDRRPRGIVSDRRERLKHPGIRGTPNGTQSRLQESNAQAWCHKWPI